MITQTLYHKVDANHVRNLGEESVADHIQAVLEIAKNAYDGDSISCQIIFQGVTDKLRGFLVRKIIFVDNGIGMTFFDLEHKWMRIGNINKREVILSPILGRRVVGAKGMGHFACQKLGDTVTITSNPWNFSKRVSNNLDEKEKEKRLKYIDKTIVLKQNWNDYKGKSKDLTKIPNEIEILQREVPEGMTKEECHGLKIEITKLKQEWSAADIERVRDAVSSLVAPKPTQIKSTRENEFVVNVDTKSLDPKGEIFKEQDEKSWLKFAPYHLSAKLRGKRLSWKLTRRGKDGRNEISGKTGLDDMKGFCDSMYFPNSKCGDLDIELYDFPRGTKYWQNNDQLPPLSMPIKKTKLTSWMRENSGIKIYKDNVRVMPYGEPGNDWLELEKRYGKRARDMRTGHVHRRNTGIIGFVILSDEKNPNIVETATRRELINNEAFISLAGDTFAKNRDDSIMLSLIRVLEANFERIDKLVNKGVTKQSDLIAINRLKQAKTAISKLPDDMIDAEDKRELLHTIADAADEIVSAKKDYDLEIRDVTSLEEMYRGLASFGVSALAYEHETVETIRSIHNSVSDLEASVPAEHQYLVDRALEDIRYLMKWRKYVKGFASMVGDRGALNAKTTQEINFQEVIDNIKTNYSGALVYSRAADPKDDKKIQFEFQQLGELKHIIANPLHMDSLFINLITNSIKALKQVRRENPKIVIKIWKEGVNLVIEVSDNGLGIPEESKEVIFQEFQSKWPDRAYKGMGLGLSITNEVVTVDYDGELKIGNTVDEKEKPGEGQTTFIIKMPLKMLR